MRQVSAIFLMLVFASGSAMAESRPPTIEEYAAKVGPQARIVPVGELVIDGHRLICGTRPTVFDPTIDSWGGAHPGYIILNPKRLDGLPTIVKLFVYAHECRHQFPKGRSERVADCSAVRRLRKYGWMDEAGLEELCKFWEPYKGTSVHDPGPERCKLMRRCFAEAAPKG